MLIASFLADSLDAVRRLSAQAWDQGVDAVEIRIDHYQGELAFLADFLRSQSNRRWIVTKHRVPVEQGGVTEKEILQVSQAFAEVPNAWIDLGMEIPDQESSQPSQRGFSFELGPIPAIRMILSFHDFVGVPRYISKSADIILASGKGPVFKVAYTPMDIRDSFHALDLMHRHKERVIAICMGEEGTWTRVLAKKLKAFGTFCSLSTDQATAPGQLTLLDMMDRFRWKQMDADTKVFGLVGNPVAHSLSPKLFNHWFTEHGVNAVYLPLRVADGPDCLSGFLKGCLVRPWLDVGGFSVTLPHKTAVASWLGAGVDRTSECIGAINTLVVRDGRISGYNTDCQAATSSLVEALGCSRNELRGMAIDVLGAGGSARAVLSGLRDYGCRVTVFARNERRLAEVGRSFSCDVRPWSERVTRTGTVLINCTPIGMWPKVDDSPVAAESLSGCQLVFDLIYNPLETKLLRDAAERDVKTLGGLDMFVRQASTQFELWTGCAPDLELAKRLLESELRDRTAKP
ncbi:MAG: type I 3-dehydroquinate dehydratase [Planctomycetota bacterium]